MLHDHAPCFDAKALSGDARWCQLHSPGCASKAEVREQCSLTCGQCVQAARARRESWCDEQVASFHNLSNRTAHGSASGADRAPPCDCSILPWRSAALAGRPCRCDGNPKLACFGRCCQPPGKHTAYPTLPGARKTPSLVVVSQTHKLTGPLLERFRLAQKQLHAAGARYFVAFLIGDGVSDRCPADSAVDARTSAEEPPTWRSMSNVSNLTQEVVAEKARELDRQRGALRRLRRTLGEDAVWCIDPRRYELVWPGFFAQLRSLGAPREEYPGWHGAFDQFQWAWVSCDLHALVGAVLYLLSSPRPPDRARRSVGLPAGRPAPMPSIGADYLWVMDWDIGWTGDLHTILSAYSAEPADLLTSMPPTAHSSANGYKQQPLRTYLTDDEVRKALLATTRYSMRMVGAMIALVGAGNHTFCETRGPSHCAKMPWCTHRSMLELHPEHLMTGAFSCCATLNDEMLQAKRAEWLQANASSRVETGQLLHRVH